MEFAAVQIIAVDTVQNSGLHKTGYLMNAGHFSKNTVSTGDLNRGRRTESRLLFGSFCRSKKNKLVPFRELPDKQEVCPCRGSTLRVQGSFEVLQTSKQLTAKAVSLEPLRGISRRQSRLTDDKTPQSRLKKELYS